MNVLLWWSCWKFHCMIVVFTFINNKHVIYQIKSFILLPVRSDDNIYSFIEQRAYYSFIVLLSSSFQTHTTNVIYNFLSPNFVFFWHKPNTQRLTQTLTFEHVEQEKRGAALECLREAPCAPVPHTHLPCPPHPTCPALPSAGWSCRLVLPSRKHKAFQMGKRTNVNSLRLQRQTRHLAASARFYLV